LALSRDDFAADEVRWGAANQQTNNHNPQYQCNLVHGLLGLEDGAVTGRPVKDVALVAQSDQGFGLLALVDEGERLGFLAVNRLGEPRLAEFLVTAGIAGLGIIVHGIKLSGYAVVVKKSFQYEHYWRHRPANGHTQTPQQKYGIH
jgi:hypothetical protein